MSPRKSKVLLLSCFLMAGLWAGSIVTFLVANNPSNPHSHTAQAVLETLTGTSFDGNTQARPRLFNRDRNAEPSPESTTPYAEESAPELDGDFVFPEAVTDETPPAVEPPAVVAEPESTLPSAIPIESITNLFGGSGSFADIMNIAVFALALFGGFNAGGSDGFFKIILGLFSKKGNFGEILQGALDKQKPASTGGSRCSRRRNR